MEKGKALEWHQGLGRRPQDAALIQDRQPGVAPAFESQAWKKPSDMQNGNLNPGFKRQTTSFLILRIERHAQ